MDDPKIDGRFCSITELNRTIGVRLSSIDFWFDFVRLDTGGGGGGDYLPP